MDKRSIKIAALVLAAASVLGQAREAHAWKPAGWVESSGRVSYSKLYMPPYHGLGNTNFGAVESTLVFMEAEGNVDRAPSKTHSRAQGVRNVTGSIFGRSVVLANLVSEVRYDGGAGTAFTRITAFGSDVYRSSSYNPAWVYTLGSSGSIQTAIGPVPVVLHYGYNVAAGYGGLAKPTNFLGRANEPFLFLQARPYVAGNVWLTFGVGIDSIAEIGVGGSLRLIEASTSLDSALLGPSTQTVGGPLGFGSRASQTNCITALAGRLYGYATFIFHTEDATFFDWGGLSECSTPYSQSE